MIPARLLHGSRVSGTDRDVTVEWLPDWHLSGVSHYRERRTRRPQSVQRLLVDPRKGIDSVAPRSGKAAHGDDRVSGSRWQGARKWLRWAARWAADGVRSVRETAGTPGDVDGDDVPVPRRLDRSTGSGRFALRIRDRSGSVGDRLGVWAGGHRPESTFQARHRERDLPIVAACAA
jgi:hypothetical protein